jgi:excisionase family DNA binding protein
MRSLRVREVAEHYGVTAGTVLAWLRSGELRAINVGRRVGARKPRWRITPEALAAFERRRTPSPTPAPTRRRKRAADHVMFYAEGGAR